MVGSRRAALARSPAEVRSRRSTSSDSTSSKNSAWLKVFCRAKASRSGRVSRLRPSFKRRSSDRSSVETFGAAVEAISAHLP